MNGASLAGQLLRVLQSFLVMKMIGPSSYGFWLGLQLIATYAAFCHLGVEGGLSFRLAYYRGREDTESSRALSDTGYLFWTAAGVATAAGIAAYALFAEQRGSLIWWALIAIAVLVFINQQTLYLTQWHVASLVDFITPSAMGLLQIALGAVFVLPLTYYLGLTGVIVGTLLAAASSVVFWRWRTPYSYRRSLSRPLLLDAMRVGFPTMLINLGVALMQNVDRLLILSLLGAASLGYYGITALGGTFVYGLLAQAGNAINPHIAAELGKGGETVERLRPYLVAPTRVFAALSATLLSLLAFAVPPLVQLWLPQYTPGISAFLFYIPGFFFLSIALTAGNILNGVLILRKKQRYLIYIQMLAVLVEVAFSFMLVWSGLGLVGVALASTLSYLAYGLTTLLLASRYVIPDWRERSRFLLEVFAPLILATIVVVACFELGNILLPAASLTRGVLQLLIVSALGAVTLWVFRHRIGIHDAVPIVRAALRRRIGKES